MMHEEVFTNSSPPGAGQDAGGGGGQDADARRQRIAEGPRGGHHPARAEPRLRQAQGDRRGVRPGRQGMDTSLSVL